jgi:hypothetical protein
MSRRKEPVIPSDLLDQLLAGGDAAAALQQGGLLDSLKKALAERALNAEMDHHLGRDEQAGNSRNGYVERSIFRGRNGGTWVLTKGTGTNSNWFYGIANQLLGPLIFRDLNRQMSSYINQKYCNRK